VENRKIMADRARVSHVSRKEDETPSDILVRLGGDTPPSPLFTPLTTPLSSTSDLMARSASAEYATVDEGGRKRVLDKSQARDLFARMSGGPPSLEADAASDSFQLDDRPHYAPELKYRTRVLQKMATLRERMRDSQERISELSAAASSASASESVPSDVGDDAPASDAKASRQGSASLSLSVTDEDGRTSVRLSTVADASHTVVDGMRTGARSAGTPIMAPTDLLYLGSPASVAKQISKDLRVSSADDLDLADGRKRVIVGRDSAKSAKSQSRTSSSSSRSTGLSGSPGGSDLTSPHAMLMSPRSRRSYMAKQYTFTSNFEKWRRVSLRIMRDNSVFDILPLSGKVVVFDSCLPVRHALRAMAENDTKSAPIWDSKKGAFIGLMTVTDFAHILAHCHGDASKTSSPAPPPPELTEPTTDEGGDGARLSRARDSYKFGTDTSAVPRSAAVSKKLSDTRAKPARDGLTGIDEVTDLMDEVKIAKTGSTSSMSEDRSSSSPSSHAPMDSSMKYAAKFSSSSAGSESMGSERTRITELEELSVGQWARLRRKFAEHSDPSLISAMGGQSFLSVTYDEPLISAVFMLNAHLIHRLPVARDASRKSLVAIVNYSQILRFILLRMEEDHRLSIHIRLKDCDFGYQTYCEDIPMINCEDTLHTAVSLLSTCKRADACVIVDPENGNRVVDAFLRSDIRFFAIDRAYLNLQSKVCDFLAKHSAARRVIIANEREMLFDMMIKILAARQHSCVVVDDNRQLKGVLTLRDIFHRLLPADSLHYHYSDTLRQSSGGGSPIAEEDEDEEDSEADDDSDAITTGDEDF
jgi:predicted transcriptional regulator